MRVMGATPVMGTVGLTKLRRDARAAAGAGAGVEIPGALGWSGAAGSCTCPAAK